jgi:hypothetical protein
VTALQPRPEDGGDSTGWHDALAAIADAVLGAGPRETVDLLDLLERPVGEPVDVVRAGDDLLPRLAHQRILGAALARAARALRPGGLLLAPVPELDRLRRLRPAGPPPRVVGHGEDRRVTVQLWDWSADGRSYGLDVVQLVHRPGGWEVARSVSTRHQVLTPEEVCDALTDAGFGGVQRLAPAETGHPLPVYVAVAT